MAYKGLIVPVNVDSLDVPHTVQMFNVGTHGVSEDGNEYVYMAGVASTVVGSWVTFDEAYVTTLLVASAIGPISIALSISVASNWGWYGVWGKIPGLLAANCADNAKLGYETASGNAGDGKAAGDEIYTAISRGSTAGAAAVTDCQISYPFVDDVNGA